MELYWARLRTEGSYPLRRGAWYPVNEFAKDHVLLDVYWAPVNVLRSALEIVETRPLRWTVVPRPEKAVSMPESWGPHYAVCPNCGNRSSLEAAPEAMGCQQCDGLFPVAWEEKYLGRELTPHIGVQAQADMR